MVTKPSTGIYDFTRAGLVELLADWGFSAYHAEKVWSYLYHLPVDDFSAMVDLRDDLRERLATELLLDKPTVWDRIGSRDGLTQKALLALADGELIETVIMQHDRRATVCVSTQVGCAMGCVFCATGQMGFTRHLTAGEIITQVLYARDELTSHGESLRNVVFMGMGEPLHNYEATMTAIDIMTDDKGLAIGPRFITVSTVGLPNAIRRLAHEKRPFNLAVSLHAATDGERSALVPLNRRWNLNELLDACREFVRRRGRRIFFEWALIAGENDSPAQAEALGRLLAGLDAHVNLIPLNPTSGYAASASGEEAICQFQATLARHGLPSTVRQRRGIDVDAGCGQLRTHHAAG